jgi:NodT family efflux transporter outer membrane factor (OMF) lipoprotein
MWWKDFNDPALSSAVETALGHNYDLQAAAARVEQAAAQAKIAGADLQPRAQVGLAGSRRRQNFIGFPIPGREESVLSTTSTNLGVSLDVTWEVDLWGRLSARAQAAVADFQVAGADLRGAHLSIAGQTTKAWFATAAAYQQVQLAETTVQSFRSSTQQVRDRFQRGVRPALDLRLSLANLAGAEALLQFRRQQLDGSMRQLEVILGRYPGRELPTPEALPDTPPEIPAGLPAELVARRPDLVAAERRLAAADSRLSAARGDLYPRLSLTTSGGTASRELTDLVDGNFSVWNLAFNLLQPVFQGGRLRAAVERADAGTDEAVATYASAVLRAYAEVESTLASESLLAERQRHLADAAEQSRAAERLADDRYRRGLSDFITVLESQRRALVATADLIDARQQRLQNRVDLYLALGGGFERSETTLEALRAELKDARKSLQNNVEGAQQ